MSQSLGVASTNLANAMLYLMILDVRLCCKSDFGGVGCSVSDVIYARLEQKEKVMAPIVICGAPTVGKTTMIAKLLV